MLLPQWLTEMHLVGRMVEEICRSQARRRLVELEQLAIPRCQTRQLLGLVRRAQTTRFGREHDFRRIHTAEDFRRLVPVRDFAELWRTYWQPAYPNLAGTTWPGPIPALIAGPASANGPLPCLPWTPALQMVHGSAALDALAFVFQSRPRARFLSGRILTLAEDRNRLSHSEPLTVDSSEAWAFRQLPAVLRAFLGFLSEPDARPDTSLEERLRALAQRSASWPVTCVVGPADRLLRLFALLKEVTGRDRMTNIWPRLAAVVYGRGPGSTARVDLVRELGHAGPLLLEVCFRPEGPIAVEDPQYGQLRLLPDHGVYFEFVPADQLGKPHPSRLDASQVELGVPYALALTTPAGLWACWTGLMATLERRDPPLLRLLEAVPVQKPAAPDGILAVRSHAHPFPVQPPHPRSGDSPAMLPERTPRSASSAHADRE